MISPHFDYHHDVRPRTGICTHKIQAIVFCPSARTIQHLLYHIQTALVYPLVCQDLFEVAFDLLYAFTILDDSNDKLINASTIDTKTSASLIVSSSLMAHKASMPSLLCRSRIGVRTVYSNCCSYCPRAPAMI